MDKTYRKILLLLSTTRMSAETINLALDLAADHKAKLLTLFILDNKLADHIVQRFSEDGWIGGKPSAALHTAILKEYFTQGRVKLEEIHRQAGKRNIDYSGIYVRGEFVPAALEVIKREQVDLIIVTRRHRSHLSRFIFGSAVAELKEKVKCEIRIVDE